MLKLCFTGVGIAFLFQPPSGGCVLKPKWWFRYIRSGNQPPSGGCVLKLECGLPFWYLAYQPPSGGCVLKHALIGADAIEVASRLQAAVC